MERGYSSVPFKQVTVSRGKWTALGFQGEAPDVQSSWRLLPKRRLRCLHSPPASSCNTHSCVVSLSSPWDLSPGIIPSRWVSGLPHACPRARSHVHTRAHAVTHVHRLTHAQLPCTELCPNVVIALYSPGSPPGGIAAFHSSSCSVPSTAPDIKGSTNVN